MKQPNLYVLLALFAEQNASLRKREKGFENLVEILSEEVDRQQREIESLRQPKKTYHGKPYFRKAA